MITTITLNPSLDTVVMLDDLSFGRVNQSQRIFSYPAGKGIDVSRAIHILGGETCAVAVLAGTVGKTIKTLLHAESIPLLAIETMGETRSNILLENVSRSEETIILHDSQFIVDAHLQESLRQIVVEHARNSAVMVFAGSVPHVLPTDIYRDLLTLAHAAGCRTILDTRGEALRLGIEARPCLIKPNKAEFEGLLGHPLRGVEDARWALSKTDYGAIATVVSLGGDGALMKHEGRVYRAPSLSVPVASYAGAGDSLVGGVAMGMALNLPLPEALKMGVAAATATLSQYGSSFFDLADYTRLLKDVVVEEMD